MKKGISIILFFSLITVINAQKIPKWKINDLQSFIKKSETPVVINFWATYCGPCLQELPYFQEMIKKYESTGIKLLLVSLDFEESYPDKIRRFADKHNYTSKIVWLHETNADYFCPKIDSAWSGVMPATVFVNNKKGYHRFIEEQIPKEKLETEIKKMTGVQ